jgi:hypothetical protein
MPEPTRENDWGSSDFADFVRELEEDPEVKRANDEARERLRRELDEGDEEAYV